MKYLQPNKLLRSYEFTGRRSMHHMDNPYEQDSLGVHQANSNRKLDRVIYPIFI